METYTLSEKTYWKLSLGIVILIFSTIFIGNPLRETWSNQGGHALVFVLGMLLVGSAILIGGLSGPDRWQLWAVRLGLAAVFVMFFLRLSLAERSHVIEYSVLAFCLHQALKINPIIANRLRYPWILSLFLTIAIAGLDEGIQALLPKRVGSWEDLAFDAGAAAFAIGAVRLIKNLRKRLG